MKRVTTQTLAKRIIMVIVIFLYILGKSSKNISSPTVVLFYISILGISIFAIAVNILLRYLKYEKIIFDISNQPLLDAREAVSGVSFSGEGFIKADNQITSYYTGVPCVYYHTTVTEIIRSGRNTTLKVLKDSVESANFYFVDKTGKILVDITNMDTDRPYAFEQASPAKIKSMDVPNSEMDCEAEAFNKKMSTEEKEKFGYKTRNDIRINEYVLRADTPVYIYGFIDKINGEKYIIEHKNSPLIISRKTQKSFVAEFYKGKNLLHWSYVFMYVGSILILPVLFFTKIINTPVTAVIAWVLFCIYLFLWLFSLYNRIIVLKNRALNAYSNIEGELKRRYDLIPQFEAVTKQYSAYEKATLERIVQIRDLVADKEATMNGIKILSEKYPELGASKVFQNLSDGLIDTEERVAYSRSFYNSAVEQYNTSIQTFPSIIVSVLTGQKPLGFFHLKT